MKRYYLAYGSNLNLSVIKERCKDAIPIGTMKLEGYRLVYKGQCDNYAYLTIEESNDSYVPIGIYEISYLDEKSLDMFEGYPYAYDKKYVPINVNGKENLALIYVMNKYFDYHIPSKRYIDICSEGYRHFNFNQEILDSAYNVTWENIMRKHR